MREKALHLKNVSKAHKNPHLFHKPVAMTFKGPSVQMDEDKKLCSMKSALINGLHKDVQNMTEQFISQVNIFVIILRRKALH